MPTEPPEVPSSRKRRPTRGKRRIKRGWIPNYHGAWAMIIIPPLVGIIEGGFRAAHIPLLAMWWVGYFFFFAATVWLRSQLKDRFRAPVVAYGIATVVAGLATWWAAPYLWRWVPVFLPLVALAGWAAWKRQDRSLGAGLDTVVAASLLLPVSWDVASGGSAGLAATPEIWTQTALLFGYFAGTVFYVKTNIRERNSNGYLAASIAWHALWLVGALIVSNPWHVAVWVVLVARAIAVPLLRRRGVGISVTAIGVAEVVTSILVTASLLA